MQSRHEQLKMSHGRSGVTSLSGCDPKGSANLLPCRDPPPRALRGSLQGKKQGSGGSLQRGLVVIGPLFRHTSHSHSLNFPMVESKQVSKRMFAWFAHEEQRGQHVFMQYEFPVDRVGYRGPRTKLFCPNSASPDGVRYVVDFHHTFAPDASGLPSLLFTIACGQKQEAIVSMSANKQDMFVFFPADKRSNVQVAIYF